MKKSFIIFSLFICTALAASCSKDQDQTTTNTEAPSPTDRAADDPGAMPVTGNHAEGLSSDTSSAAANDYNRTSTSAQDAYKENQNATSGKENQSNRTSKNSKDSVTSVAGELGSGSGVGDGGSLNAAQQKKK